MKKTTAFQCKGIPPTPRWKQFERVFSAKACCTTSLEPQAPKKKSVQAAVFRLDSAHHTVFHMGDPCHLFLARTGPLANQAATLYGVCMVNQPLTRPYLWGCRLRG